jgi:hypothetical protein
MPLLEYTEFDVPMPAIFSAKLAMQTREFFAAPLPAALVMLGGMLLAVSVRAPDTTTYIENCRKSAAAGYPGEVRLITSHISDSAARIKLHIEGRDGRELVLVCDGASGAIARVIRIDE